MNFASTLLYMTWHARAIMNSVRSRMRSSDRRERKADYYEFIEESLFTIFASLA